MPEPFEINLTTSAEADLLWFTAYAQRIILNGIEIHLRHQPTFATRKMKPMRPNPVAGWELCLGDYRVLYDVDETARVVVVEAIGEKRGNRLLIQGKEFVEHESH